MRAELVEFLPLLQILNAIRKHMDLGDTQPFAAEQLESVDGFSSKGVHGPAHNEMDAVAALRAHFAKPAADLQALLAHLGLDTHMPGGLRDEW